jgi:hypothetical protein
MKHLCDEILNMWEYGIIQGIILIILVGIILFLIWPKVEPLPREESQVCYTFDKMAELLKTCKDYKSLAKTCIQKIYPYTDKNLKEDDRKSLLKYMVEE